MRARTIAVACALAALAASSCGGSDKAKTTTAPAATPTAQATPAARAEPVIDAEGVHHGWKFRFTIDQLVRSGPTVVVNAKVSLVDPSDDDDWQVSDTFDDGLYEKLSNGGDETGDVFDGVALIDPVGRKKYLVARDSDGRCVCSNDLSDVFVRGSDPVTLQATLTAPPPNVKTVDVVVPHVQTFHDVPIAG
jgi:hypothetical protein